MRKKSQVIGQVFVYIIAIFVFSLLIIWGYKQIVLLNEKKEQIEFLQFQKDLDKAISRISSDYGSVDDVELFVGSGYSEVCFVDLTMTEANHLTGCDDKGCSDSSLAVIDDSAYGSDQIQANVFLGPPFTDSFYVGDLSVDENNNSRDDRGVISLDGLDILICFDTPSGILHFTVEGRGDHAFIRR